MSKNIYDQSRHRFFCLYHLSLQVLISVRKWHDLPFILWIEFSTCRSTNFKRRWLDLFCNYYHIQCFCIYFAALVVIFCCNLSFSLIFWHIRNFIINLDTMPLSQICDNGLEIIPCCWPNFEMRQRV
jgi:hypothetical protein